MAMQGNKVGGFCSRSTSGDTFQTRPEALPGYPPGDFSMKAFVAEIQAFTLMTLRTLLYSVYGRPRYIRATMDEMHFIGVDSLLIVASIGGCVGMIWTLQISTELATFGAKLYLGKVTSPAIVRELGPIITAITVAGKACSAIAAELASMVVTNQVDALRAMGVDPIRRLVVPRMLASLVMVPLLTLVYDAVAILGGGLISVTVARVRFSFFMSSAVQKLGYPDLFIGLMVKPMLFGFMIAMISCYLGLTAERGSAGVRNATTQAVVLSFVCIFGLDFLITRLTLSLFGV
jgi:phospholipid/cholesterol/gamma-HCH transport system permease protein